MEPTFEEMEDSFLDFVQRSQEMIKDYNREVYASKLKILNLQDLIHGARLNYLTNIVMEEGRKNQLLTKDLVCQSVSIENQRYCSNLREALEGVIKEKPPIGSIENELKSRKEDLLRYVHENELLQKISSNAEFVLSITDTI